MKMQIDAKFCWFLHICHIFCWLAAPSQIIKYLQLSSSSFFPPPHFCLLLIFFIFIFIRIHIFHLTKIEILNKSFLDPFHLNVCTMCFLNKCLRIILGYTNIGKQYTSSGIECAWFAWCCHNINIRNFKVFKSIRCLRKGNQTLLK